MSLENTVLPNDAPAHVIVAPTMNRWDSHLPNFLTSTQHALGREHLGDDTWIIIGDASNQSNTRLLQEQGLSQLDSISGGAKVFLLTPDTQQKVAAHVQERTGIHSSIVQAILTETGYASQRQKLDVVTSALTLGRHPIRVATFDDDIIIPDRRVRIKEAALPPHLSHMPNSQTLLRDVEEGLLEELGVNHIGELFNYLGLTVAQVREQHGLPVTYDWNDTMHESLEQSRRSGQQVQFTVNHGNQFMSDIDDAVIIGTTPTKHGIPDYRTTAVATHHLHHEFPTKEVTATSFPSGDNLPFAYHTADTNVDSAAFSRFFDDRTALLPWWFVSSAALSANNPLGTVKGHYRADNELLPHLLKLVATQKGIMYLYLSGISTQIYHNRARTGYRPDIHEQASASLIGNIAATEAVRLLTFHPTDGTAQLQDFSDAYQVPHELAQSAFDKLYNLAMICGTKIQEIEAKAEQQIFHLGLLEQYHHIKNSIQSKLANFNFSVFHHHLSQEIKAQLAFYRDVLNATPTVIAEVQQLILSGHYPVLEYVPTRR